ncbi:MAG: hypothetical protein ABW056_07615 [Thermoanaerobaculia bacterium]
MAEAPRRLARRLHSLTGVVPVGVFLVFHLAANTEARKGADAYNAMTRQLHSVPLLVAIEILLIAAPLFFHGIYGLFLIAAEPADSGRSPQTLSRGRRAIGIAQRATGIVLFAFLLLHLWTARLVQIHDHESLDLFRLMQAALANPWIRAAYVAGILSATFHLSTGLYTFAETWGLAVGTRARRLVAATSAIVFAGLTAMGLSTLSAFRL